MKFAITNSSGKFELKVLQDVKYKIEISYIGYKTFVDTIQLRQKIVRNYTLTESINTLDEVIIKNRLPVKVKKDTITYRPDRFTNGRERKLRDVLKKLPGIEIDRKGNAKVNGKPVTKLLVEGKEFFTGDEKLGINNIPADAVDEIEAIDNYNEVSFLKGLNDSEKLVLNIKLKEGNKKFAFGSIESGLGNDESYLINPSVFYYSPRTSVNFIGDLNNTGNKEFTIEDYLNFEGDVSLFGDDPKSYFKLLRDDFSQFLRQEDFQFNKNHFGALSVNQDLSETINLSAYSIWSSSFLDTKNKDVLVYNAGDFQRETRETEENNNLLFTINKLKLRYANLSNLDIKYDLSLKANKGNAKSKIVSENATNREEIVQKTNPKIFHLSQSINLNKQINTRNTYNLGLSYEYIRNKNQDDFVFNKPIFSEIINFIDDNSGVYNFNQTLNTELNDLKLYIKYYLVLHRFHHIYPEFGINFYNQSYRTRNKQVLDSKEVFFSDTFFGNDTSLGLIDNYIGMTYKAKFGKLTFKPSVFVRNYIWSIEQSNSKSGNKDKLLIMPRLNLDWQINDSEKIRLKYKINSTFADAKQLGNKYILKNFNRLHIGNSNLENELYESLSLFYNKHSFFKGFFLNLRFNYVNKLETIREKVQIKGIDQVGNLFLNTIPEKSYSANFSITKRKERYKFKLNTNTSFSNYIRSINGSSQTFQSNTYSYKISVKKTNKEKDFDVELGWDNRFSVFYNNISELRNKTVFFEPYIDLNYRFLRDFVVNFNYNYSYYENKSIGQVNRFQESAAFILYNRESSPWTFKLSATNIFDIRFKSESFTSDFLFSDSRIFIQPRIVLLSAEYRF